MTIKVQGTTVINNDREGDFTNLKILPVVLEVQEPSLSPLLTIVSEYTPLVAGVGTHASTDWQVLLSADSSVVWESLADTVNLTSITVGVTLTADVEYIFRARYRSSSGAVSAFTTDRVVAADFPLGAFGNAACGGFYIGTICAASTCYALIVAPNATGCAQCQWKTTRTTTAGTTSTVDGYANTYGPMDNTTHPAGNFTATRTINGFSDWYLPARDELNVLYVNDGGSTNTNLPAGEGFAGANYWSSTEYSASSACFQYFNAGIQVNSGKASSIRVRAVRREPI
jgi:hypothetical protein